VIRQTVTASRQIDGLLDHYMAKGRDEAISRLSDAVEKAFKSIEANPTAGRAYPGPYAGIARHGYLWIKVHRYWFGWSNAKGYPVLTNVLFDSSNIPGRVAAEDDEADPQ
jgi:plasmid stabilization system protein ParE